MILKRLLFAVAAMFATVVLGARLPRHQQRPARLTLDRVIRWNRTLLQIIRTPGAQPANVHQARNLAIMTSVKYTRRVSELKFRSV